MPSVVAWLDYSDKHRREALSIIDAFREKETVDELGVGRIRDAFAERLFPGTSTIQTRARYFLFIPWTYSDLERRRANAADVAHRARKEEIELIEELIKSGETDGVIGARSRASLQRLPSAVYWQGLRTLGVCRFPDGQAQYHKSFGAPPARHLDEHPQEASEIVARARGSWHPDLPRRPRGFPAKSTLRLTREEAEFLRDRIIHTEPHSYFAFLVRDGKPSEVTLPWEHPDIEGVSMSVAEELEHARCFAEAIWSAPIVYNLMLAEKAELPDRVERYRDRLEEWRARRLLPRHEALQAWSRPRFWELVGPVPLATRRFIDSWLDLVVPGTAPARNLEPGALADLPLARSLILDRERQLKGKLARLENPTALRMWNGDSGISFLNYRWHRVQRIAADIHDGLTREKADDA